MSQGDGLSCRQCASRVVTRSPCKCQRMRLVPGCTELWGADARVPLTFRNCATALRVLFLVSDHLTNHLKIIIHQNHWPKSLSKVKHYIYFCSITTREKMWILFKTGWRLWPPTRAISPGRGSRLSKPIDRTHIAQPCLWPRNHENYTLGFLFFWFWKSILLSFSNCIR